MSEPVKRNYASALRAEQARATRRAIVAAAARLFVDEGYGATTIDAIADAAGVSRKTVFTSVGGKVQALKLAIDWAIVGDDEPIPLLDRPEIRAQAHERDARRLLRAFAGVQRRSAARVARLMYVAASAAGTDPAVRTLTEASKTQRRFGMGALAGQVAERGALRATLTVDEAGDILALFDPLAYHRLVHELGWSAERYEEWIGDAIIELLIDPEYAPTS